MPNIIYNEREYIAIDSLKNVIPMQRSKAAVCLDYINSYDQTNIVTKSRANLGFNSTHSSWQGYAIIDSDKLAVVQESVGNPNHSGAVTIYSKTAGAVIATSSQFSYHLNGLCYDSVNNRLIAATVSPVIIVFDADDLTSYTIVNLVLDYGSNSVAVDCDSEYIYVFSSSGVTWFDLTTYEKRGSVKFSENSAYNIATNQGSCVKNGNFYCLVNATSLDSKGNMTTVWSVELKVYGKDGDLEKIIIVEDAPAYEAEDLCVYNDKIYIGYNTRLPFIISITEPDYGMNGAVDMRRNIVTGDDLNALVDPGTYYCETAAICRSVYHAPILLPPNGGFVLTVNRDYGIQVSQKLVSRNYKVEFERHFRRAQNEGWTNWCMRGAVSGDSAAKEYASKFVTLVQPGDTTGSVNCIPAEVGGTISIMDGYVSNGIITVTFQWSGFDLTMLPDVTGNVRSYTPAKWKYASVYPMYSAHRWYGTFTNGPTLWNTLNVWGSSGTTAPSLWINGAVPTVSPAEGATMEFDWTVTTAFKQNDYGTLPDGETLTSFFA